MQRSKCSKFGKTRGENPQMCPFAELFHVKKYVKSLPY